jgi:TolA-binding protein
MKKTIIISSILVSTLLANEPSVYGAGDIDSPNPYGLTKTERNILKNRREIQNLKNKVQEYQNRIEGLISIIDGLNKEVLALKEQMKIMNKTIEKNANKRDDNKTYALLLEMGTIVDKINNSYVSKEELNQILSAQNQSYNRYSTTNIPESLNNNQNTEIENGNEEVREDISTIYRQGVQLFSRKSYNFAKEKFEEALKRDYKPASTNYYLGEIAYYTKNYNDAIEYYKKSASLYDNATYMKVLYLHTAISLYRLGEKEQARKFFEFVIDNYPNTKSAEIAKKYLG